MARMPRALKARKMRRAISPRLATRTLSSTLSGGLGLRDLDEIDVADPPAALALLPACVECDGAAGSLEPILHDAVAAQLREGRQMMPREADVLERQQHGRVGRGVEEPAQTDTVAGDERIAERAHPRLELLRNRPRLTGVLETDELARVVRDRHGRARGRGRSRGQPPPRHASSGLEHRRELRLPGPAARLRSRRRGEMADDDLAGCDVAALVLDAAREDPARGRLVDRVGALEVLH